MFDIERRNDDGGGDILRGVVNEVGQWLGKKARFCKPLAAKLRDHDLMGEANWFDLHERMGLVIKPIVEPGQARRCWAMQMKHPDSSINQRQWVVHVGIDEIDSRRVRFSMEVEHHLLDTYIGEPPAMPARIPPVLVSSLLESNKWFATSGGLPVTSKPVVWKKAGDIQLVKGLLTHPERVLPVVLLTPMRSSGVFMLDADSLASKLKGAAIVVQAYSLLLDDALSRELPTTHTCYNGSIRVYMPHVMLGDKRDSYRHRFFPPAQIETHGEGQVEEWLVEGVARRDLGDNHSIKRIEDVQSRQRHEKIEQLRQAVAESGSAEELAQLKALVAELTEERNALVKSSNEHLALLEIAESERDEAKEQVANIHYLEVREQELSRENAELHNRARGIEGLESLPETLPEVIERIGEIHPTIAFTEQGLASARGESLTMKEVHEAWRLLWKMATDLHDIFSAGGVDFEREFYQRSGFELAMSEGLQTKNDKRLMKLRRDRFDGEQIEIVPHTKGANDFRIYFCWHKGKIVVGRFGHLETAGTRRRKEG